MKPAGRFGIWSSRVVPVLVHHAKRVSSLSVVWLLPRVRKTHEEKVSDTHGQSKTFKIPWCRSSLEPKRGPTLLSPLCPISRLFFFPMHLNLDVPGPWPSCHPTTNPILLEPSTSHPSTNTSPFLLSLTSSRSPASFYDVCSLFCRYVSAGFFLLLSLFRRSIYGWQTSGQSASWVISVTIADIVACSTTLNDFDWPSRFIYPICHLSSYNRVQFLMNILLNVE